MRPQDELNNILFIVVSVFVGESRGQLECNQCLGGKPSFLPKRRNSLEGREWDRATLMVGSFFNHINGDLVALLNGEFGSCTSKSWGVAKSNQFLESFCVTLAEEKINFWGLFFKAMSTGSMGQRVQSRRWKVVKRERTETQVRSR